MARAIAKLMSEVHGVLLGATAADRFRIMAMFAYAHTRLGRARALFGWMPTRGDRPRTVVLRSGVRVIARRRDGVPFHEQFALDVYGVELPFAVSTVIDLGANVGFAAVALAKRYPDARFVCVEPSAESRPLLEHNLALNGVRGEVIGVALAGVAGRFRVAPGAAPARDTVVPSAEGDVEGVTLSELLDRAGISEADLVKIDIEGSERELFEQVGQWAARVRAVIAELHGSFTAPDADALLAPHGFERATLPNGVRFAGVHCWLRDQCAAQGRIGSSP
jgi:FkbM family methyltransferase